MSQQINLFNPAFIRPRDWLSLKNVMAIYAGTIVLMMWYYSNLQSDAEAANQQRHATVAQYEAVQKTLLEVSKEKSHTANLRSQEQEVQQLMQRKETQARLLSTFKYVQGDGGHHLLDYMTGFARQSSAGVWITGFKVNAFEQNMSLVGRALQAEYVPVYIEQLNRQTVFQGQLFSGLTLKAVSQTDGHDQPGVSGNSPSADATVASKPAGEATTTVAATEKTAVAVRVMRPPISLVEFEVKGMPASEGAEATGLPLVKQEVNRD